jgi:hypothetical protein
MIEQEDQSERQLRDFEHVQSEFVGPRLQRAERIYNHALTSLWLGNAGAAIASLSFIGAAWHDGKFPHALMWPLSFFVVGLVAMGVGAFAALLVEGRILHKMEGANSILDLPVGSAKRPTEHAGLTYKDWRTKTAIIGAMCFVLGCLTGLGLLTLHATEISEVSFQPPAMSAGEDKVHNLQLQRMCAEQAQKALAVAGNPNAWNSYENHYSAHFGRCFVLFEQFSAAGSQTIGQQQLDDAFEGRNYGYFRTVTNAEHPDNNSLICRLTPLQGGSSGCHAKVDWEKYVALYMQN